MIIKFIKFRKMLFNIKILSKRLKVINKTINIGDKHL